MQRRIETISSDAHGRLVGKNLACKRCQYKKLKCSRSVPCQTCQKAEVECEYRTVDRKRRPASQEHVIQLQNRVAWLEDFITRLQHASPTERDSELRAVNLTSVPSSNPSLTVNHTRFEPLLARAASLNVASDGSMSFHGPTSIYQVIFDEERPGENNAVAASSREAFRNADNVIKHFKIDLDADIITQTLILFFKWQYPNFMFVYRDAFLRAHYGEREGSKYWSHSLLLSVCALGSLMLPQHDQSRFNERCHDAAESIAMVTDLTNPSITAVQTFLCLAFYDIGTGNLSKGWAFSGIAFRMAQDLGFQKDPETWISVDHSLHKVEDLEIRRRIYWGCYISDKLISLILGRPVYLLFKEAEVHELNTQPDPPFIIPWRSVGFDNDSSQLNTDISMIPYIKEQIKLAQTLERMLSSMSCESSASVIFQQPDINSLNLELIQWKKNLCDWADFNVWDMINKPLKPSIAAVHARIALNLSEAVAMDRDNFAEQAREACMQAATEIHSLLRRYRTQHGLRCTPLISVYAMAQATRVMRSFGTREQTKNLAEAMSDVAVTWILADKVMQRTR